MCEPPPPQQHSVPSAASADCRTATCALETGRAPLETSGTCGEPVGSFRSTLSVDAVCTHRACAGRQTEGRSVVPSEGYWEGGRLNVACVGPRVQSAATPRRRVFRRSRPDVYRKRFRCPRSDRPTREREGQLVRRSGYGTCHHLIVIQRSVQLQPLTVTRAEPIASIALCTCYAVVLLLDPCS